MYEGHDAPNPNGNIQYLQYLASIARKNQGLRKTFEKLGAKFGRDLSIEQFSVVNFLFFRSHPAHFLYFRLNSNSAPTEDTCYVFKKIRFRKDPFWGVHTCHHGVEPETSFTDCKCNGRGLILGNVPPPENHGLCSMLTETDLPRAPIAFFVCFLYI